MSRTHKSIAATGLGLLVVGLLLSMGGFQVGTVLAVAGLIVIAPLWFLVNRTARRSPGWTRVWNPGAARRDYEAELAARDKVAEPPEGDEPKA